MVGGGGGSLYSATSAMLPGSSVRRGIHLLVPRWKTASSRQHIATKGGSRQTAKGRGRRVLPLLNTRLAPGVTSLTVPLSCTPEGFRRVTIICRPMKSILTVGRVLHHQ